MSLDNNQREPVPGITQAEAVKLVQYDGNAFIALTLSTSEGRSRFIISQDRASQLIEKVQKALGSPGTKPLV